MNTGKVKKQSAAHATHYPPPPEESFGAGEEGPLPF
jgi:hypothetical protein